MSFSSYRGSRGSGGSAMDSILPCIIGCGICLVIVVGVLPIVVGGWLIGVGRSHSGSVCEAPLATWAVVQGSLGIVLGLLALVAIPSYLLVWSTDDEWVREGDKEATRLPPFLQKLPFWNVHEKVVSITRAVSALALYVSKQLSGLVSLAAIGVLIWGTVIAFQGNLWNRMKAAPTGNNPPCDSGLYFPSAIYIMVVLSLVVVILTLLILIFAGRKLVECCCCSDGCCRCRCSEARGKGGNNNAAANNNKTNKQAHGHYESIPAKEKEKEKEKEKKSSSSSNQDHSYWESPNSTTR